MITLAVILVASYLLGSIPVSLIAGRIRGIDLHAIGSGNAGATNVFRTLGVSAGVIVFIMDVAKGFLATRLVTQVRLEDSLPAWLGTHGDIWLMVIAGAAAMLGHVYTIIGRYFYGTFKGGKGVATGTGMLLGLIPIAIGVAMALFSAIVYSTRIVSLGSIIATVSLPITLLVQRLVFHDYFPGPIFLFVAIVPVFILYTHRENVRRLLAGTEKRIGAKSEETGS